MAFTLLIIFLALLGAYYLLGAPLMDYIHRFVREFVHSFPLAAFFAAWPAHRRRPARPEADARRGVSGRV